MTWSYTENPADSPKDAVRFHSGDVLREDQQRSNEEIAYALSEAGDDVYLAAALICDSLARQYARYADKSVGNERESLSQRSTSYADRAAELRARAASGGGVSGVVAALPFVGGVSASRLDAAAADTDLIPSAFRPGQFDAV